MSEEIQQKYRVLKGRMPDPSRKRLVILTGARQTGKTTLAKAGFAAVESAQTGSVIRL